MNWRGAWEKNGHEVNMVTAWPESGDRKGWFETRKEGIRVHWILVPYGNTMSLRQRVLALVRFAWAAAHRAADLPTDAVYATSTPLTVAILTAFKDSLIRVSQQRSC